MIGFVLLFLGHYRILKNQGLQGACDSKNYWIYAARKLGMVDTVEGGIEITKDSKANAAKMPTFRMDEKKEEEIPLTQQVQMLVFPGDKSNISPFLYTLLSQTQLIHLLPCEKVGKRQGLPTGLEGLGCKYCARRGRLGFSRSFPLRRKTLPTRVQDMYKHLQRCPLCPQYVKTTLHLEKSQRSGEINNGPFYTMLWARLNRTEDIKV